MAEWTDPHEQPIRLTVRGWATLWLGIVLAGVTINTLIPLDLWGRL